MSNYKRQKPIEAVEATATPLFNLPAERAVLSSVFFENAELDQIEAILTPQDFYNLAHQAIFAAMSVLRNKREPISEITIEARLRAENLYDEEALLDIQATTPCPAVGHYAAMIKELAIKREIIALTTLIKRDIYEDNLDGAAAIETNIKRLEAIGRSGASEKTQSLPVILENLKDIKRMPTIETGVGWFDRYLFGGLELGALHLVSGEAESGKTLFCEQIFYSNDIPALYFPLEFGRDKTAIRRRNLDRDLGLKRDRSMKYLSSEKSFLRIVAEIRKYARNNGVKLVVIDSQVAIEHGERGKEQDESAKFLTLRDLAIDLSVAIVMIVQNSKDDAKRGVPSPMYSQQGKYAALSFWNIKLHEREGVVTEQRRIDPIKNKHDRGRHDPIFLDFRAADLALIDPNDPEPIGGKRDYYNGIAIEYRDDPRLPPEKDYDFDGVMI